MTKDIGCTICQNLYLTTEEPGYIDCVPNRNWDQDSAKSEESSAVEVKEAPKTEDAPLLKLFDLAKVPSELKNIIFSRMDQISFYRMRRTNKYFSNYIDVQRGHMKVPLFHNWHAAVRDDYISLSNGYFRVNDFIIGKNFTKIGENQEIPMNYDIHHTVVDENASKPHPVRNDVKVYLKAWKMNEELRKELTGNIRWRRYNISGVFPEIQSTCLEFLNSTMTTDFAEFCSVNPELITHCLSKIKPNKLILYSTDIVNFGQDLEVLSDLALKEVKAKLDYKNLKNIKRLEVKEPVVGESWFDVIEMVRLWCTGNNNMNSMLYSAKQDMRRQVQGGPQDEENQPNLGLLCCYGEELERHVIDAFVQPGGDLYPLASSVFSRDLHMNQRPEPTAFLLNQMNSGKKGICMRYGSDILFTLVENEELLNTPKPDPPEENPEDVHDDQAEDDDDADDADADDANDDDANDDDANEENDADGADEGEHDDNNVNIVDDVDEGNNADAIDAAA